MYIIYMLNIVQLIRLTKHYNKVFNDNLLVHGNVVVLCIIHIYSIIIHIFSIRVTLPCNSDIPLVRLWIT